GLYRPVAQFIYAALWNVGGGRPLAFHVWAVGVHIAAALAVFALLAFALAPRVALCGALLFAVHPVHVEAVASIVGSADALATLLAVGFVLILLGARDRGAPDEPVDWRMAVLLGALYALAIGAKESAAATPALGLVALWAWRPAADGAPRRMADALRRGWRVWLACAAALAVMTIARGAVLGEWSPPAGMIADGSAGVHSVRLLAGIEPARAHRPAACRAHIVPAVGRRRDAACLDARRPHRTARAARQPPRAHAGGGRRRTCRDRRPRSHDRRRGRVAQRRRVVHLGHRRRPARLPSANTARAVVWAPRPGSAGAGGDGYRRPARASQGRPGLRVCRASARRPSRRN